MRTHIWKALRARSKAIHNALNKYNTLAREMQPPAPILDWKNIVNYGFIAEFDLLKHHHSHFDITLLPWVPPANREVANKFHKIRRAKEEIIRLNVEICRLRTSIADEELYWEACAQSLVSAQPNLAAELRFAFRSRRRINEKHLERLRDIEELPDYSGSYCRGTRIGSTHLPIVEPRGIVRRHSPEPGNDTADEVQGNDEDGINDIFNRWETFMESSL